MKKTLAILLALSLAACGGGTAAVQAANENKDGDILFGLNETRRSQVINGGYENLKLADWPPSRSGGVSVDGWKTLWKYCAESSDKPLTGAMGPENRALVDIAGGTYHIAGYLGVPDKAGRSDEETEAVNILCPNGVPGVYTLKNFALTTVEGAGMSCAGYVSSHPRPGQFGLGHADPIRGVI